jgi:16S rRNA C967 or C1407 C5-methylase (RsmB/RsmF family)
VLSMGPFRERSKRPMEMAHVHQPNVMPAHNKPSRSRRRRSTKDGPRQMTAFERPRDKEEPPWLVAALDALARHRGPGEPLERALKTVMQTRRPSSADRRLAGDAVFGWARRRLDAERAVEQALQAQGGRAPSRRERDAAAVLLVLQWAGEERAMRLRHPARALIDGIERPQGPPTLPAWLKSALEQQHDAEALLASLADPAPIGLAVDPRQTTPDEVARALVEEGLEASVSTVSPIGVRVQQRFRPTLLDKALRAKVWPMDEGSQRVALAVDAEPGELVLDLCSGGGGKARALASTGCDLVCADVNPRRLRETKRRVPDAAFVLADGTHAPFADGAFDAVLIDAPCSGTGTLRRAPDLCARLSRDRVDELVSLQSELLREGLRLVRPGGRVIYATCSLLPEENEGVRAAVVPDSVAIVDERTLRPDREGTDGFFISVLRVG